MDKPVITTAKVTLTIELVLGSTFGPEWTFKQLEETASREAIGAIRNLSPETATSFARRVKVIGEPVVCAVIVKPEF